MKNSFVVGGLALFCISTFFTSALPSPNKWTMVVAILLMLVSWIVERIPNWTKWVMTEEKYINFRDSLPNPERNSQIKAKILFVKLTSKLASSKFPILIWIIGLALVVLSFLKK